MYMHYIQKVAFMELVCCGDYFLMYDTCLTGVLFYFFAHVASYRSKQEAVLAELLTDIEDDHLG